MLPVPVGKVPSGGVTAYPDLISFAGAVGSSTGLSLRSPRPFQDLFLAENILTNRVGQLPSRPIAPAGPPAPGHTETRTPPQGTQSARSASMDVTTTPTTVVTCAKPGCGLQTTPTESVYVDGCGEVCPGCAGPLPEWWNDVEPPF